jgi:hypothetical protein
VMRSGAADQGAVDIEEDEGGGGGHGCGLHDGGKGVGGARGGRSKQPWDDL